jgi:nucleoside-diphosphate kinase
VEQQATVVLIKPQREAHVVAQIFSALVQMHEKANLQIAGFAWISFDPPTASKFYQEHAARPWFSTLVAYMTSASCLFVKVDGIDAVTKARLINGPMDPREASEYTMRGRFKSYFEPERPAQNFVHASSDITAARRELHLIEKILSA